MRRIASLATACLLTLTACGTATQGSSQGSTKGASDDPDSASETSAPAAPDRAGKTSGATRSIPDALRFTADTLDGKAFEGADLAGRPVVLWFWAPWCPTCRVQAPGVSALAEEYGDRVGVVGVGGLDDADAMDHFAARVGDGVTLLEDEEGTVWRRFGVTEQSTYVVLDARGATVASGHLDDGELRAVVDDLAG